MYFDSVSHDPNYDDATGGFSVLREDILPESPSRPAPVHFWPETRAWIARRVLDPAMTYDVFAETMGAFWGSETHEWLAPLLPRMEEVASALLAHPEGVPSLDSETWERILESPTDEEWAAHLLQRTQARDEALRSGKSAALARSVEFGRLTVREMAAYFEGRPNLDIWNAVTTLAPHLKVRKAMRFANEELRREEMPPIDYPLCDCAACVTWFTRNPYLEHNSDTCADPHCCASRRR